MPQNTRSKEMVNVMRDLFNQDIYKTPEEVCKRNRGFLDKIHLFQVFMHCITTSRKLALQNKYDAQAWEMASYNYFKGVENYGGCYELSGLSRLSSFKEPVVFISNHMSTLETFVFPCLLLQTGNISFVVKESLTTNPLFGPVMRGTNPIVVKRKNPREDFEVVMQQGMEKLKQGVSVIIFPQSTRSTVFRPEEFNSIGIKLAKKAGVSVMPIAIKTDFWGNGKWVKDLGPIYFNKKIHMHFGEKMSITANGKEQHQQIVRFIEEHIKQWSVS